jgi:hypothetical protein
MYHIDPQNFVWSSHKQINSCVQQDPEGCSKKDGQLGTEVPREVIQGKTFNMKKTLIEFDFIDIYCIIVKPEKNSNIHEQIKDKQVV